MFSCKFWEICKSTFFIENLRWLLLSIRLWTAKIEFTITVQMTIQHFLPQRSSTKQYQFFHWSIISRSSCSEVYFTTIIFYYVGQTPPDVQWRKGKTKLSRTWKGKSFFIYLSFRIAFSVCFWENVLFTSYVACYCWVICSCRKAFK